MRDVLAQKTVAFVKISQNWQFENKMPLQMYCTNSGNDVCHLPQCEQGCLTI